MLFLADPGLPLAATEKLAEYQTEVDGAGDYASQVSEGKRLFSSRNNPGNATFRAVREGLSQICAGAQRCAYCEDSVGDEVEHIKPKDLYPEVVFSWSNYVFACGPCNGRKNNKYAVMTAEGMVVVTRPRGAPIVPPTPGTPAFIDPRKEDPLDFLAIDLLGTFLVLPREGLAPQDYERADFSISTLDLNRDILLAARANAFVGYRARLSEYRTLRDGGASLSELDAVRDDLLVTPHPTVWEEMKRQQGDVPHLNILFDQVPEALGWTRVI